MTGGLTGIVPAAVLVLHSQAAVNTPFTNFISTNWQLSGVVTECSQSLQIADAVEDEVWHLQQVIHPGPFPGD